MLSVSVNRGVRTASRYFRKDTSSDVSYTVVFSTKLLFLICLNFRNLKKTISLKIRAFLPLNVGTFFASDKIEFNSLLYSRLIRLIINRPRPSV